MGRGSPAPMELLCSYFTDLVITSIRVIREEVDQIEGAIKDVLPR